MGRVIHESSDEKLVCGRHNIVDLSALFCATLNDYFIESLCGNIDLSGNNV